MLKKGHILVILVSAISLVTVPVFAQNMGFYSNKVYDFSFNVPMDWRYLENFQTPKGEIIQVLLFPSEFSTQTSNTTGGVGQFFQLLSGPFSIDSPLLGVIFENVPESEVPNLNNQALEQYSLEQIRLNLPNARIIKSDVESTSWGWIVSSETVSTQRIGNDPSKQYHTADKTFYFKDRESYSVGYLSPEEYYDRYFPVYEKMIDSLVIKGVAVPEFHEIALMVLGSSIVLVIIFARKFTKF